MTADNAALPAGAEASDYWKMLEDRTAGTFYWDREGDAVEWSPKLLRVLGYPDQKATNLVQVEELLHPEDRAPHAKTLSTAVANSSNYTVDIRLRNSDGEYQAFRAEGYWLTKGGLPARILIGFLTEVSEVARLRDQVARGERLFQAFFDNAPAAVYIKDTNQNHLYGNAFAAKIAGCTVEEFVSKSTSDLFDEETSRALAEVDRRILDHGETVVRHGEFDAANGDKHYVYDTSFPLEDPRTGETLIGGFGLDTTRQHKAEIQEFLSEISSGVERGTRLTRQLLAYARKAVLIPELMNLNDVLGDMDRMLRRILPESMSIETVRGGGLWNARINRTQVESAVLNLALNARDAMPDGGKITIETSNIRIGDDYIAERTEDIQPGRFVLLAVTDTGTGMSEEVMSRAFDPFYTTKDVDEGSGMGLSMVEGLMRQIGGTARIYTEPTVGTTVKLYFPASFEEPLGPIVKEHQAGPGTEHILLVEDDHNVRTMFRRMLGKLGYMVTEAENGDSALEILRSDQSVQLLVTDIVMPGQLQGPDLARNARALRPDLPVIFMSGYPREASIHGNALRPDDINLMKPVKSADLAKTVRSVLDKTPTPP